MADPPSPEFWRDVNGLFDRSVDLPDHERAVFLDRECSDPSVRREVDSLLRSHEVSGRLDGIAHALEQSTRGAGDVAADPPTERTAPARIGAYRLERAIATGGMGDVHLAYRSAGPDADEPLALKILRGDVDSASVRRRFGAERAILARLEHSGIARLLDDGVTPDGLPYLIMEYVDGEPIDRHCDHARMPVGARLDLFSSVCDAVSYAHGVGVVHRDLKPANILVTREGSVRLLDFGIAKILDDGAFATQSKKTTTGMRILTPEYGSPEQILGSDVTPASDVYQLGLLLYRLLAGRVPPVMARITSRVPVGSREIPGIDPPSRVVRDSVPDRRGSADGPRGEEVAQLRRATVAELATGLADGLDAVVLRALSEDPAARFTSAAALREAVDRAAAKSWRGASGLLDSQHSGQRTPDPSPAMRRAMKRIFGMGVGALYFVIAFGAFSRARAGWAADHSDVGVWWTVIAAFLTIAALSALAGTWIHTQQSKG